jgi:hypothetical protein
MAEIKIDWTTVGRPARELAARAARAEEQWRRENGLRTAGAFDIKPKKKRRPGYWARRRRQGKI